MLAQERKHIPNKLGNHSLSLESSLFPGLALNHYRPRGFSQMYQRCQILHRLIKVQSEERSWGNAGSGSLREENEERVTSEFITPLVLMALQNGACDATQRSPFTHSCCLGRTWMIRLAGSNVFSLHLSPVGSLISALFRRGSGCVYGTGWAT